MRSEIALNSRKRHCPPCPPPRIRPCLNGVDAHGVEWNQDVEGVDKHGGEWNQVVEGVDAHGGEWKQVVEGVGRYGVELKLGS